ncbi:thyrotropin-releasing hormone receptor-like [Mya arenaria]|uniref:thyrotropin-releasing hormone receptor-like n=1 Tax=Mya arenaria TaxID=6604 RepID=UPI0022E2FDF2|nr:thyrotropin-releasing hormone receptor-like [Mya arenaria]
MTAALLYRIVPPVLLVMGTFGNILTIIVLTRPASRKTSTAIYLIAMAFADLMVLYTGLLRWWMIHSFGIDISLLGNVGCRLIWFFVFASPQLSSWLLVAVTCERIISTKWPHKAEKANRVQKLLRLMDGVLKKTQTSGFGKRQHEQNSTAVPK